MTYPLALEPSDQHVYRYLIPPHCFLRLCRAKIPRERVGVDVDEGFKFSANIGSSFPRKVHIYVALHREY